MIKDKQQQLLWPIARDLAYQQQGLICCAVFKTILYLFNLTLVCQLYTNMQVKCQSIAISLLAIYLLFVKYNHQGSLLTYLRVNSTKIQLMFILIDLVLMLNLQYMSLVTPIICLTCYSLYAYQLNRQNQTNIISQIQRNALAISVSVVIQLQLILLRYEGYIQTDWRTLLIVLLLGSGGVLVLINFFSFYFLCASPRREEYYDEQQSEWSRHRLKQTLFSLFIAYNGYFGIVSVLLEAYLSQCLYKYVLLVIFALCTVQMLSYGLFFKKIVVLQLNYDQFAGKIVVQVQNGSFIKLYEVKPRVYLKNELADEQICCVCENKATVMHETCKSLVMCYDCFHKNIVEMKWGCVRCKSYGSTYYYSLIWHKDQLKMCEKISTISKYLTQGQYISRVL